MEQHSPAFRAKVALASPDSSAHLTPKAPPHTWEGLG
jgi:hypothetical protein